MDRQTDTMHKLERECRELVISPIQRLFSVDYYKLFHAFVFIRGIRWNGGNKPAPPGRRKQLILCDNWIKSWLFWSPGHTSWILGRSGGGLSVPFSTFHSSRNITIKRILLLLLRTEEQQALLLLYCSLATQTASSSSTKSSVPLRLSRCYCVLVVGLLLLLLLYEKVSSQTVDSQLSSKRELRSGKSCSCVP